MTKRNEQTEDVIFSFPYSATENIMMLSLSHSYKIIPPRTIVSCSLFVQ